MKLNIRTVSFTEDTEPLPKRQEANDKEAVRQIVQQIMDLQGTFESNVDFAKRIGVSPQKLWNMQNMGEGVSVELLLRVVRRTKVDLLAPLRGEKPAPTQAQHHLKAVADIIDAARDAGLIPDRDDNEGGGATPVAPATPAPPPKDGAPEALRAGQSVARGVRQAKKAPADHVPARPRKRKKR
jgi:hypothetical protein